MDEVELTVQDHVAQVTLNRPERRNALSRSLVQKFGEVGRRLLATPGLQAIVVTGAGTQAFCAGADLKERSTMSEGEVLGMLRLYRSELAWLEKSEVVTIAAINGVALGGGLELALLCDLRLAAEHTVLGLVETSLGVIPGAGGTQRLPRLVGQARAKQMVLRAERLSAQEAKSVGLLNEVLPGGETFMGHVQKWVAPMLKNGPLAQMRSLAAIRKAEHVNLEEGLDFEMEQYQSCLVSEDRREALAAFLEKREPVFKGR